ncbi:gamma-glutamylcyclotransferase family protein [Thalassoglobus sp. JC818]|uniref:gamma-glutamylcyclotransferase family protein n=1 Tax=Thalassoglobus sp. JC818 TaxID=3232136 RepID=UPI00345AC03F
MSSDEANLESAEIILFVYGTLQRGDCRNYLLKEQEFLGGAVTLPKYRLFDLGAYPGLTQSQGAGEPVHGELWRITDQCRARLDIEEGVDEGLYSLKPIEIQSSLNPIAEADVVAYFYLGDTSQARPLQGRWMPR